MKTKGTKKMALTVLGLVLVVMVETLIKGLDGFIPTAILTIVGLGFIAIYITGLYEKLKATSAQETKHHLVQITACLNLATALEEGDLETAILTLTFMQGVLGDNPEFDDMMRQLTTVLVKLADSQPAKAEEYANDIRAIKETYL